MPKHFIAVKALPQAKCEMCGDVKMPQAFHRKSRTGTFPPICSLCWQTKPAERNALLKLKGAHGIKEQSAEQMRRTPTEAEAAMLNILREARIACKQQAVLYGFIADFKLKKERIIIEVDGGYHQRPDQADYDRGRDAIFRQYGYRVLRLTNEEVLSDPAGCVEKVRREKLLASLNPAPARRAARGKRDRIIQLGRSIREAVA